jgi:hypothetical protein
MKNIFRVAVVVGTMLAGLVPNSVRATQPDLMIERHGELILKLAEHVVAQPQFVGLLGVQGSATTTRLFRLFIFEDVPHLRETAINTFDTAPQENISVQPVQPGSVQQIFTETKHWKALTRPFRDETPFNQTLFAEMQKLLYHHNDQLLIARRDAQSVAIGVYLNQRPRSPEFLGKAANHWRAEFHCNATGIHSNSIASLVKCNSADVGVGFKKMTMRGPKWEAYVPHPNERHPRPVRPFE